VKKGAKRADKALEKIGYTLYDPTTGEHKFTSDIPEKMDNVRVSGPMWMGTLHEKSFLKKLELDNNLGTAKRLAKFLDLWLEEANMPTFFYDINEIASMTKTSTLPINGMLDKLKEHGFCASRTHFSPTGVKTDADIGEIMRLVSGE
jgi:tRNA (guanine26-N2/guanine27-N2)-dimethyltransferase